MARQQLKSTLGYKVGLYIAARQQLKFTLACKEGKCIPTTKVIYSMYERLHFDQNEAPFLDKILGSTAVVVQLWPHLYCFFSTPSQFLGLQLNLATFPHLHSKLKLLNYLVSVRIVTPRDLITIWVSTIANSGVVTFGFQNSLLRHGFAIFDLPLGFCTSSFNQTRFRRGFAATFWASTLDSPPEAPPLLQNKQNI